MQKREKAGIDHLSLQLWIKQQGRLNSLALRGSQSRTTALNSKQQTVTENHSAIFPKTFTDNKEKETVESHDQLRPEGIWQTLNSKSRRGQRETTQLSFPKTHGNPQIIKKGNGGES